MASVEVSFNIAISDNFLENEESMKRIRQEMKGRVSNQRLRQIKPEPFEAVPGAPLSSVLHI